jgi:hypothetical protein
MKESIVAGLVSGLFVALFVVVFRTLWRGTLVPWFENRVYKDIQIEGSWFALYPTAAGEPQQTISLTRHGHAVSGTIICNTGEDEGQKYRVTGSFRNLILTLLYETEDHQKVDRGTLTLRCVRNGERLVGKQALYHDFSDAIREYDVLWFRDKEDLATVLHSVKERDADMEQIRKRDRETLKEVKRLSEEAPQEDQSQDSPCASGSKKKSEQTPAGDVPRAAPEE